MPFFLSELKEGFVQILIILSLVLVVVSVVNFFEIYFSFKNLILKDTPSYVYLILKLLACIFLLLLASFIVENSEKIISAWK